MKNVTTNQKGFSLVELMVVVAIIGILAAMSVGQVQRQIAKSRQAEAKTNLSSLYTAEKSLFAEYSGYSTHFNVINAGFEGQLRYNVGFLNAVAAPGGWTGNPGNNIISSVAFCPSINPNPCTTVNTNGVAPGALAAAGILVNSAANTFAAGARAFIFQAATVDQWAINQNKTIANVSVGIP